MTWIYAPWCRIVFISSWYSYSSYPSKYLFRELSFTSLDNFTVRVMFGRIRILKFFSSLTRFSSSNACYWFPISNFSTALWNQKWWARLEGKWDKFSEPLCISWKSIPLWRRSNRKRKLGHFQLQNATHEHKQQSQHVFYEPVALFVHPKKALKMDHPSELVFASGAQQSRCQTLPRTS